MKTPICGTVVFYSLVIHFLTACTCTLQNYTLLCVEFWCNVHKCLHCICENKWLHGPCELFRGIIASSVSRAHSMAFWGVSMFYDMLWIIPLIYPSACSRVLTLFHSVRPLHLLWSLSLSLSLFLFFLFPQLSFSPPLLCSTTWCVCVCVCGVCVCVCVCVCMSVSALWSLAITPQQWNLDAAQRSGLGFHELWTW